MNHAYPVDDQRVREHALSHAGNGGNVSDDIKVLEVHPPTCAIAHEPWICDCGRTAERYKAERDAVAHERDEAVALRQQADECRLEIAAERDAAVEQKEHYRLERNKMAGTAEKLSAQLAAVTAEAAEMREALEMLAHCKVEDHLAGDPRKWPSLIARDALASHAGSALLARLKASEEVNRFADLACAVLLHSANRFHTLNDVPRAKEAIDIRNKLVDALAAYDAHATDAKEQK